MRKCSALSWLNPWSRSRSRICRRVMPFEATDSCSRSSCFLFLQPLRKRPINPSVNRYFARINVYTLNVLVGILGRRSLTEKHRVSFEEAATIFADPEGLDWQDLTHSNH